MQLSNIVPPGQLFVQISRPFSRVVFAAAALAVFPGCGSQDRVEISVSRERVGMDVARKVGLTTAQRFGGPAEAPADESPAANPFRWETPEGWVEGATSRMRILNFSFGESGEGECYLTVLPGGGGGVVANVNRWRGQMGLEDASEEEILALPKNILLGNEATRVDLQGDFKGMGAEAKSDYRLLGLIQEHSGFMFFVKMVGPGALVDENEVKFDALCGSLSLGRAGG